jgi:hypothetical protein
MPNFPDDARPAYQGVAKLYREEYFQPKLRTDDFNDAAWTRQMGDVIMQSYTAPRSNASAISAKQWLDAVAAAARLLHTVTAADPPALPGAGQQLAAGATPLQALYDMIYMAPRAMVTRAAPSGLPAIARVLDAFVFKDGTDAVTRLPGMLYDDGLLTALRSLSRREAFVIGQTSALYPSAIHVTGEWFRVGARLTQILDKFFVLQPGEDESTVQQLTYDALQDLQTSMPHATRSLTAFAVIILATWDRSRVPAVGNLPKWIRAITPG